MSKALSLLGSCWENTSTDRLSIPSCDQEKPPFIIGSTSLLWAHWLWQNCTVNHDLNSKTGVVTAQPYKNHVNSVRPHAQITKPRKFSSGGLVSASKPLPPNTEKKFLPGSGRMIFNRHAYIQQLNTMEHIADTAYTLDCRDHKCMFYKECEVIWEESYCSKGR